MRIAIDKAHWSSNIDMGGGEYAKTMQADVTKGVALWFVGYGVLIEKRGQPDGVVPIASVLKMEAKGGFEVDQVRATLVTTMPALSGTAVLPPEPPPPADVAALAYNPEATKAPQQEEAAATLAKAMVHPSRPETPAPTKKKSGRR